MPQNTQTPLHHVAACKRVKTPKNLKYYRSILENKEKRKIAVAMPLLVSFFSFNQKALKFYFYFLFLQPPQSTHRSQSLCKVVIFLSTQFESDRNRYWVLDFAHYSLMASSRTATKDIITLRGSAAIVSEFFGDGIL